MKDLFVCSFGRDRSPNAADIARGLAIRRGWQDYIADYWGMYDSDFEPVSRELLAQFDRIFVMEKRMVLDLQRVYFVPEEKIINLDVIDTSAREKHFRDLLRKELTEKLSPYFVRST